MLALNLAAPAFMIQDSLAAPSTFSATIFEGNKAITRLQLYEELFECKDLCYIKDDFLAITRHQLALVTTEDSSASVFLIAGSVTFNENSKIKNEGY